MEPLQASPAAAVGGDGEALPEGVTPLATHATAWDPSSVAVTLNVTLDACIVPCVSSCGESCADTAHVVVLDDFFGEDERRELLEHLTEPGEEAA